MPSACKPHLCLGTKTIRFSIFLSLSFIEGKKPLGSLKRRRLPVRCDGSRTGFCLPARPSLELLMLSAVYDWIRPRIPLILVFMSGVGFSIQSLMMKLLGDGGYHGSFECVLVRGCVQILVSSWFIYYDEERLRNPEESVKLFGSTYWVKFLLFVRAFVGFTSIGFLFIAAQMLPIGDCAVLVMLSPLIASILSYFLLGEPWRIPEFVATVISLIGAVLVTKPSFVFGDAHAKISSVGVVFALLSAMSASMAFISVRMLGTSSKMPWANVSFSQSLGQIAFYFPAILIAGEAPQYPSTLTQCAMIGTIACIGSISQISMTIGMQREKSAAATGMRMSDVVFGFIWQALFTSDEVSALSVVGAMLVSGSIFIVILFQQKMPPKAAAGVVPVTDESSVVKDLDAIGPSDMRISSQSSPLPVHSRDVAYRAVQSQEEDDDLEEGIELRDTRTKDCFDEDGEIKLNQIHSIHSGAAPGLPAVRI